MDGHSSTHARAPPGRVHAVADFDLPDHLLPEFPPPLFLTTRPELGDVSKGQLLTIKNFFAIMDGIVTPVQMEGMRLLPGQVVRFDVLRGGTKRASVKVKLAQRPLRAP